MTGPATLIITDSEQPAPSQLQWESNLLIDLPIYLVNGEKNVIQPITVPARNATVHNNPALVKHAIAKALQLQADQEGLHEGTDFVVQWKRSVIPFHIEFDLSVSNKTCQHLASVRNIKTKNPVSKQLCALLITLTEPGPVCKGSCSTSEVFSEQTTSTSTSLFDCQLGCRPHNILGKPPTALALHMASDTGRQLVTP